MVFGIDSEYVVRDEEGKVISCHWLPTKGSYARARPFHNPATIPPVPRLPYLGTYGCDGVFLEATTYPCACRNYLVGSLWEALHTAYKRVCEQAQGPILMPPTTEIILDPSQMESLPPEAHEIGCRASLNAYGEARGPQPGQMAGPIRHAGLHIHVSQWHAYTGTNKTTSPVDLVKFLDRTAGLVSVVMDPLPDESKRRRTLYGEAGCYRTRIVEGNPIPRVVDGAYVVLPGGAYEMVRPETEVVEYRVPSGALGYFWSPIYVMTGLIKFNLAKWDAFVEYLDDQTIQSVINNADKPMAREILKTYVERGMLDSYIRREFSEFLHTEDQITTTRNWALDFIDVAARSDLRPSQIYKITHHGTAGTMAAISGPMSYRPFKTRDLASRLARSKALYYGEWHYDE